MIVLDASVLISYQDIENTNHQIATALIAGMLEDYLFVPAVTWAEVLVGAIKAGEVEDAVDGIQRQLGVAIANADGADWPLQLADVRARTGLRMPDAIVLATAEVLNAKVATLDVKLAKVSSDEGRLYELAG